MKWERNVMQQQPVAVNTVNKGKIVNKNWNENRSPLRTFNNESKQSVGKIGVVIQLNWPTQPIVLRTFS